MTDSTKAPEAPEEIAAAVVPEAPEVAPEEVFVRSFTLPTASFHGTDEELATYGEHVIREAQAIGLRPTSVTSGRITKDRAAKTSTVVFTTA